MAAATLVLPMAGAGSRFGQQGIPTPKPLIPLDGIPFFAWAMAGLWASTPIGQIICVIRSEHKALAEAIRRVVPKARVVELAAMTSGAAETAYHGILAGELEATAPDAPLIVADCDVCLLVPGLTNALATMMPRRGGVLTTFPGEGNPAYSYVRYDADGRFAGTVEKVVASDDALTGCYGFADPATFLRHYRGYADVCPYPETYVSGLYNRMLAAGEPIRTVPASLHCSFGTPEERDRVDCAALRRALGAAVPAQV